MLTESFHHVIANAAAAQLQPSHATLVFSAAKTGGQALITRIALKASGYNGPDANGFDLVEKLPIEKSKMRFFCIDENL